MIGDKRPTIVVLGGINMDLIGVTSRLPFPGETMIGEDFYTAPGGKGGNQAVGTSRMGAITKMIGRVGKDMFGPGLLDGLSQYGVDVSGVSEDPDASSGIAVILLDSTRQNHIVQILGANMRCDHSQVEAATLALKGADALMLQLEIPSDTSQQTARIAKEIGVTVIWDPAPPVALPGDVYPFVDLLTPNQTEATALTGIEVTDVESARAAGEALVKRGVASVVVKLGEDGAFFLNSDSSGHVPSYDVKVVDTVAAGDAFGSALACALTEGMDLEQAVGYGTAAGALAVTRPGAQEAMPSRTEVESLISSR